MFLDHFSQFCFKNGAETSGNKSELVPKFSQCAASGYETVIPAIASNGGTDCSLLSLYTSKSFSENARLENKNEDLVVKAITNTTKTQGSVDFLLVEVSS